MVDRKASAVSVKANDYAVCKSRLQNFLFLFSQTFTVHCTLDIVHCTLVQTATSASEVTTMWRYTNSIIIIIIIIIIMWLFLAVH